MLAIIAIVFVLTAGASSALELINLMGLVTERQKWALSNISSQLSLINNAFNDFLYFVMSAQFRGTCHRLLSTRHCRGVQQKQNPEYQRARHREENGVEMEEPQHLS